MQFALLPHADRVISNSVSALRALHSRISPGRGFAIPNGVECSRYQFSLEMRNSQRAQWGVADRCVVVGLVGRLDPKKNHRLLIDALQRIRGQQPNVLAIFIGDGSATYRAELQAYAENEDVSANILWAGASDDLCAVYSALDILCLCSVTEGFPNVIAEAMCVGLPCVATDVGDVAELVGDCGWVVPGDDINALAQGLMQAWHALPTWNRDRPRRRMLEQFSVEALADRTLTALAPYLERSER